MAKYQKKDARAWAREHLVGCSGVTIPSYSADLKRLNEQGIRHDIAKIIDLGFSYTLLCTEVAITPEENAQFTAIAKDTAGGKLGLFFHTGFGTLAENIEALKEYNYFVYAKADGKQLAYGEITEYGQVYNDGTLEMHFVVPLAAPVDPRKAAFAYQMYDPSFYIAMDYKDAQSVASVGAMPPECRIDLKPTPSDAQTEATRQMLSEKDQNWTPPDGEDFGSLFAQPVAVECGRKAAAR